MAMLDAKPKAPKCECSHSKYVHIGCFKGKCVGKPNQPCNCQQYVAAKNA